MKININKNDNYIVTCSCIFKEKEISLKAKGLLCLMLSLPREYDYSVEGLTELCKENENAISTALKELQNFKYLKIRKLMPNETQSNKIEYAYEVYEQPYESQGIENQALENQALENQALENRGLDTSRHYNNILYNNINNNNIINNNNSNINTKDNIINNTSNIDTNKEKDKENKKEKEKEIFQKIISENVDDDRLIQPLREFTKMRVKIKKPLTPYGFKLLVNKLYRLGSNTEERISILNNSIENCYQGIFPLKKEYANNTKQINGVWKI